MHGNTKTAYKATRYMHGLGHDVPKPYLCTDKQIKQSARKFTQRYQICQKKVEP